jgi:hypothetical protein
MGEFPSPQVNTQYWNLYNRHSNLLVHKIAFHRIFNLAAVRTCAIRPNQSRGTALLTSICHISFFGILSLTVFDSHDSEDSEEPQPERLLSVLPRSTPFFNTTDIKYSCHVSKHQRKVQS